MFFVKSKRQASFEARLNSNAMDFHFMFVRRKTTPLLICIFYSRKTHNMSYVLYIFAQFPDVSTHKLNTLTIWAICQRCEYKFEIVNYTISLEHLQLFRCPIWILCFNKWCQFRTPKMAKWSIQICANL